jgi:hypothetical protein
MGGIYTQMSMRRTNVEYSSKYQAEYCTATFAKRVLAAVFFRTNNFKQMEDIIFVKRTNKTGNCRTYNNPVIKLEYPTGRFLISQKLADILNVDNDNGLMFGFNQKAKTGFVIKDDEPDAFILRRKDKHSLRFTSKDLQGFFIDTFELLESGKSTFYFNVSSSPNDRGLYSITWDV